MRVVIKQRNRAEVRLKAITYSAATAASQGQAEGGTDNQRYMTALRTKQQIDARLADQVTAEGGSDNVELMTSLRTKQQVDARLASEAEAEAGTDAVKLLTPSTGLASIVENAKDGNAAAPDANFVARPIRNKLLEWLSPEDFGAVPVTDWANPEDSTAALAKLFAVATALNRPVHLNDVYASSSPVSVGGSLYVHGRAPVESGIIFVDCNGFTLTHTAKYEDLNLRNFALITTLDNTRTALRYVGASGGGGSPYKNIDQVMFVGLDRYRQQRFGTASANTNGWLIDLDLEEVERLVSRGCFFQGPQADLTGGFLTTTYGIRAKNVDQVSIQTSYAVCKHTAYKVTGDSEGFNLYDNTCIGSKRGFHYARDGSSASANGYVIANNHFSCTEFNINFGEGDATRTGLHRIVGNLLFAADASGFRSVVINTDQVSVEANTFYALNGTNSVANGLIDVHVTGGFTNTIEGNIHNQSNTIVKIDAGVFDTTIAGNTTRDNGTTAAAAPVVDAGSRTIVGLNFGQRILLWPTNGFHDYWTTDSEINLYTGASKLRAARFVGGSANSARVVGSATGVAVVYGAEGSDANIGVQFAPKGTAQVAIPVGNVPSYADDAAAAAGGVPIGGLYRTASALKIRVT